MASDVSAMRRALICGVSGQDGAYLAKTLLESGCNVIGTARSDGVPAALAQLGLVGRVRVIVLDISDASNVLAAIAELRPTEIYNLAGQSSVGQSFHHPVETFEGIALGTLNLLEAIRQVEPATRLFNAGSGEMFGDTGGDPASEATPIAPRSPYAIAKAAAYWSVVNYREAYRLYACTGILFNHDSPLRSERFVTRKIVSAAVRIAHGSGERLRLGNLDVSRDWGWAPEYVDAMQQMLAQDTPGDLVLATGTTISLMDFTDAAFSAVGLDWRDHVEFDAALARPTDIAVVRADPSQAAHRLNWRAQTRGLDVARRMVEAEVAALPR